MRTLLVASLPAHIHLKHPLYHQSGLLLHATGNVLTARHIEALRGCGIGLVYEASSAGDGEQFEKSAALKEVSLMTLFPGRVVSEDLLDRDGNLLLAAGTAVTTTFAELLMRRGIRHTFVRRTDEDRRMDQVEAYRRWLASDAAPRLVDESDVALPPATMVRDPQRDLTTEAVDRRVESGPTVVLPAGEALRRRMGRGNSAAILDTEVKQTFLQMHADCLSVAGSLFAHCLNGGADTREIRDTSTRVINGLLDHRELLFNLVHISDEREYLGSQAVNSSIIAINLGTALGFNPSQVMEIAYGAFLHDLGMLRVPAELVFSRDRLREEARQIMERHTDLGLELLRKVTGIPQTTPIIAFQHHERLDGSGYPRQRRDNLIHTFTRIVAISDIFSAMISPRPFRSSHLPYVAMTTVQRMARERRLDPRAVDAFFGWVGLYPIGSWVILQDGRIAKAISVSEQHPDRPVLRVLCDQTFRPLAGPETLDTAQTAENPILSACDPPLDGDARSLAVAGL